MNTNTLYSDILKKDNLAVFCGAGISSNSGLPLGNDLFDYLVFNLLKNKLWMVTNRKILRLILNNRIPLEKLIEIFSHHIDLNKIYYLFQLGIPNNNHISIAQLATLGIIKNIVTTNFDLLLEKAFDKINLPFNKYVNETQLVKFDKITYNKQKVNIFKIHGTAEDVESIRITLNNIASKDLSKEREYILKFIFESENHQYVLFLGYSFSDVFDIVPYFKKLKNCNKRIIVFNHQPFPNILGYENIQNIIESCGSIHDLELIKKSYLYDNKNNLYKLKRLY